MGSLVRIGRGDAPAEWMREVLEARSRVVAAPTFSPNGLYFLGPLYAAGWGLPPEAAMPATGAAYDGPP
jgi:tRNA pseudouridine38-40 synthase